MNRLFGIVLITFAVAASACDTTGSRRLGSAVYNGNAVQIGGDIGGTSTAPTVNAISGAGPINVSANTLQFAAGAGASTLTQGTSTAGAGVSLSIYPQKPQPGSATQGGTLFVTGTNKDGAGNYSDSYFGDWNLNNYFHVTPRTVGNGNVAILAETQGIQLTTTGPINLSAATGVAGTSTTPFAWAANNGIAIGAGGTFTLTGTQAGNPVTPLTGALGTNNAIVVVPNSAGFYTFDLSGLTSSTGTLQFKSGTAVCPTQVIGASLVNQLAIVVSRGSNTIACNY